MLSLLRLGTSIIPSVPSLIETYGVETQVYNLWKRIVCLIAVVEFGIEIQIPNEYIHRLNIQATASNSRSKSR